MGKPKEGRSRVVVENLAPQVDCGRFPIKRTVGDVVAIQADVFGDGHDHVRARLLWKKEGDAAWQWVEMRSLGNDRWQGEFTVTELGCYRYTVVGEEDHFETWQSDLKKRLDAGQDLKIHFETGAALLDQIKPRAGKDDKAKMTAWAKALRTGKDPAATAELALQKELEEAVKRYPNPKLETWFEHELQIVVDRERARFSSWYELFPRSWSTYRASMEPCGTLPRGSNMSPTWALTFFIFRRFRP